MFKTINQGICRIPAMRRSFAAKIPANNNLLGYIQKYQRDGYRVASNIDPTGINAYSKKK